MRILIAIKTCHKFRERADAQRSIWVGDVKGMDIKFFIGGGEAQRDDEVILDCPDTREGLPEKTKAICRYALEHEYDHVCLLDDDVYVRPERLLAAVPGLCMDYLGKVRGACNEQNPAPYCSGMLYWLSPKAMRIVADSNYTLTDAEDCMVGNVLNAAGIRPVHDGRYVIQLSPRNATTSRHGPRQDNNIIASCEWPGTENMLVAHKEFQKDTTPPIIHKFNPDPEFEKVEILIKTIMRNGYLFRTINAIEEFLPGARMVIVDDGIADHVKTVRYAELQARGHCVLILPYDSGFGAKSNSAIPHYKRKYVLIASDDFKFDKDAADGVRKLVRVMDDTDMDIASGRVNGNPYEGTLEIKRDVCREFRIDPTKLLVTKRGDEYAPCDLTVNYSLIRRTVLGMNKLHWFNDVKIGGGEHGAFFVLAKKRGLKVCWVPGVNITEQVFYTGCQDPRYPGLRGRARRPGRPALRREGIREYFCFDSNTPETC